MDYFERALLRSFLAGLLVVSVFVGVVSIAALSYDIFNNILLLFIFALVPFGSFIPLNIIFWGILFVNLPVYILRRRKIKKKEIEIPQLKLEWRVKVAIILGLIPLPSFSIIYFLIVGVEWFFIISIAVVWLITSWQWVKYMLQDEAIELSKQKDSSRLLSRSTEESL